MDRSGTTPEVRRRRLVLGYDAGCMTCSSIAKRVRKEVGDALEILSLRDPQVEYWRRRALGENAPWAPTLIETQGEEVKAWTGPTMGLALSRKLGIRATWLIMKALGGTDRPAEDPTSVAAGAGLSRASFLKRLGGAMLATSVLTGTDLFARVAEAREWVHPLNRKKVVSSEPLEGEAARTALARASASEDVRNVWSDAVPPPEGVTAARHTLEDGNTVTSVTWETSGRLLIYYSPATPIGNYRSQAMRMDVIPEEALVLEAESVNGRRRPVDLTGGRKRAAGGCPRCTKWNWGCVALWANGCGGCSYGTCPPCAAGSLGNCAVCVGCLLIACGYGAGECCRRWG